MAAQGIAVRVVSKDLARLAAELKTVAPMVRKQLPKRLRAGCEPIRRDADRRKPSARIKVGLRTSFAVSKGVTVKLVASSPSRPPLAGLMELGSAGSGGRVIRHPTYGHQPWVNQPTHPYVRPAIDAGQGEVVKQLVLLVGDIKLALRA